MSLLNAITIDRKICAHYEVHKCEFFSILNIFEIYAEDLPSEYSLKPDNFKGHCEPIIMRGKKLNINWRDNSGDFED